MNRYELTEQLMDLLPPKLTGRAVVAGSYAVVPAELAGDIDLWVLGVAKQNFAWLDHDIRKHLVDKGFLTSMRKASNVKDYEAPGYHFHVVTVLTSMATSAEKPVQILLTTAPTLQDLLNLFDMSCHAGGFALIDPNVTLCHEDFTPRSAQPRVLKTFSSDPRVVLLRLEEMSERYGHETNEDDVLMLSDRIEELRDETGWEDFGPVRRTGPIEPVDFNDLFDEDAGSLAPVPVVRRAPGSWRTFAYRG
jgi:hypothetical protein